MMPAATVTSDGSHIGSEQSTTASDLHTFSLPEATVPIRHPGINAGKRMMLELQDGSLYCGFSFGADKSTSGEMVFQTGMVGYPESITDPSYRGQILIMCYPLVGNYGAPSRDAMDSLLGTLPAHFEAARIHVAGLVVASYAGEEYSHHLASSSLGTWLREQQVPAICGIDTRALTKKIREQGSMLGRLLLENSATNGRHVSVNGHHTSDEIDGRTRSSVWQDSFEKVDWKDPNKSNLVDQGELGKYTVSKKLSNMS